MRPIRKGGSPVAGDYRNYEDAKPDLVSCLGLYCSYCERPITSLLAVEHVQPKGLAAYRHLEGNWNNFLLACVNCNSTKGDKDVQPASYLLPDRDNTFVAFSYLPDGTIEPSANAVVKGLQAIAQDTLQLTGLDKAAINTPDINGKQVALDRGSQRMNVWLEASEAKKELDTQLDNQVLRRVIIRQALAKGFFSIWMTVFSDDSDMCSRFIDAFPGTRESGCFDANGYPVSPAPNPDQLPDGGKI